MIRQRPAPLVFLFLLAGLAAPALATERPGPTRLCPEDAPEGVRLPPRPDCGNTPRRRPAEARGTHDLGGVQLRIGGRVSATYGAGR